MLSEDRLTAKAENDRAKLENIGHNKSKFEPDELQRTTMALMARIDHQIMVHEEAIKKLNEAYKVYAKFLKTYNPFETGNLSQTVSADNVQSPGACAPGREEADEQSIRTGQQ